MLKFVVLAGLFAIGYATVGDKCDSQADCSAGECCQKLNQFMVVSKKDLASVNVFRPQTSDGSCQRNKLEGESCSSFEHINGYCGCGPGLQCHGEEVPIDDGASSRMMVAPRPGYKWLYQCKKAN